MRGCGDKCRDVLPLGRCQVVGMLTERDYLRFAVHADAHAFLAGSDPRNQVASSIALQPASGHPQHSPPTPPVDSECASHRAPRMHGGYTLRWRGVAHSRWLRS